MAGDGEWEPDAENWVRWARAPGHDAYWSFRDSFFDTILPPPGRRTLEVGCGEGRVARDLAARGHDVTALDAAHSLVRHARDADPDSAYLTADGAGLPFRTGAFDVVVAYNALQTVPDLGSAVTEAARVLDPGGHLCFCVAHPTADLGRFLEDGRYVLRNPYFESTYIEERVESDGFTMTFRGWTYTLEHYMKALEHAGFVVETMREPRPSPPTGRFERWTRVPLFLNVRARLEGGR